MKIKSFIKTQLSQLSNGGIKLVVRKIMKAFLALIKLPLYLFALIPLFFIRILRPVILIRWDVLRSSRIGHFVSNTEMYLCERDAGINLPAKNYVDLFYLEDIVSNHQLSVMYKRILNVYPAWILGPIAFMNALIPGGALHEVRKTNQPGAQLDIHNLLDKIPQHLSFTKEEIKKGESELRKMGIPVNARIICLMVRDSAYLNVHDKKGEWSYHNYRDCDVQNFVLAAEELTKRGYYIVRMGAHVHHSMNTKNPMIVDYAFNGMHSDFMDIYLGSACEFCISTSTGWDGVPAFGFRKPTLFTNILPIGYLLTFSIKFMFITKHFMLTSNKRELSLREIFAHKVGYSLHSSDYESKGVMLIENTPDEIYEVAMEMADRLEHKWRAESEDEELQSKFWKIFPTAPSAEAGYVQLHGKVYARFSTHYLRKNRFWLE